MRVCSCFNKYNTHTPAQHTVLQSQREGSGAGSGRPVRTEGQDAHAMKSSDRASRTPLAAGRYVNGIASGSASPTTLST